MGRMFRTSLREPSRCDTHATARPTAGRVLE